MATDSVMVDRFRSLLDSKDTDTFDVTLIICPKGQEVERIRAHKLVLGAQSPVFKRHFYGEMAKDELSIDSVSADGFRCFLRNFYGHQINLTVDNVLPMLHCANMFSVEHLIKSCWNFIDESAPEIIDSEHFLNIDPESLEAFLRRQSRRCKIVDLFNAVVSWSNARCRLNGIHDIKAQDLRTQLQFVLPLLNTMLSVLSPRDFISGPLQSGILTADESNGILVGALRAEPRFTLVYEVNLVTEKTEGYGRRNVISASSTYDIDESFIFTVNKEIIITGLGVMLEEQSTGCPLEVSVSHTFSEVIKANVIAHRGSSIHLNSHLTLPAFTRCKISVSFKGGSGYLLRGQDPLKAERQVAVSGHYAKKITFRFSETTKVEHISKILFTLPR